MSTKENDGICSSVCMLVEYHKLLIQFIRIIVPTRVVHKCSRSVPCQEFIKLPSYAICPLLASRGQRVATHSSRHPSACVVNFTRATDCKKLFYKSLCTEFATPFRLSIDNNIKSYSTSFGRI